MEYFATFCIVSTLITFPIIFNAVRKIQDITVADLLMLFGVSVTPFF